MQIEVYKTTPSIPSKEIKPYNLGPGSYEPNFHDNKPSSRGTAFGSYVSKREVFESLNENLIGPGEYSLDSKDKNKPS